MSNRDPQATYSGPTQAIIFAIEEWVRLNLRTAMPGIVRAYDARTMRARVQPALRAIVSQPDGSTEAMDRAPIYDVPVTWPGGGGYVFHCNLDAGDTVWLMFSERGLAEFKRTIELADPPPMVMFESRDAVAQPYRAAEIVPAEGVTGGDIRDVTPTGSGEITSVEGATLQSTDGAVYISVHDDRVRVRKGAQDVTVQNSGLSATIEGDIDATATGTATVAAPTVVLDGDVQITGSLQVDGSALTHGGTNVGSTHRHTAKPGTLPTDISGTPQ